ncbi:MAG: YdiU family protein [Campylobacteraceae bacterium]|nr:YdiU family protein [Campylobacteraceae bacterium]
MNGIYKQKLQDLQDIQGRYSYTNQAYVAKWNLEVLAKTLDSICDETKRLNYLETFFYQHEKVYLELMCKRIGLDYTLVDDYYLDTIISLLESLEKSKADYNWFFYELSKLKSYEDISSVLNIAIYPKYLESWFKSYLKIVKKDNINIEDRSKKCLKLIQNI